MFRNVRRSLLVCVVLLGLAGAWVAYLNQQWFDPVRDAWFDLDLVPGANGASAVRTLVILPPV